MNYSEYTRTSRADRFRLSGKWYDTYAIDMSPYYNELIHIAVAKAWKDRYTWGEGTGLKDFMLVVLDPYHKNSHPVVIFERHLYEL